MVVRFKKQDRVCDVCGNTRSLSGLAHVDRGTAVTYLCYDCAEKDSSLGRFKRLTKEKWAKRGVTRGPWFA